MILLKMCMDLISKKCCFFEIFFEKIKVIIYFINIY